MKIAKHYRCNVCRELHEAYDAAERCCPQGVDTVYVCGECDETFPWFEKDEAEACCKTAGLHSFDDVEPTCLCGARATDEDLRDSQRLGTLIRCRPCILSLAPGMLTAEAIATGRAAA